MRCDGLVIVEVSIIKSYPIGVWASIDGMDLQSNEIALVERNTREHDMIPIVLTCPEVLGTIFKVRVHILQEDIHTIAGAA